MTTWRCMSTMQMTSGIPDDAVVNTWHVYALTGSPAWADVAQAWESFMDGIRILFPGTVAQTGHSLKVYNLADPEPRAPVDTVSWQFGSAPSGTTLPSEVALCVSYEGIRISGQDQARRRGRIFLGPIDAAESSSGRPGTSWPADLVTYFKTFIEDLNTAGVYFVVRSRVDDDDVQVARVWVDNAFDTQRRRGVTPTSRATDSITQVVV